MAENVVMRYDPHFHLGMRVMTLIWCFRGWQVCNIVLEEYLIQEKNFKNRQTI
jgi:hypothetical protein